MREFVEEMMRKRKFWENYLGRDVEWTDWSDQSAFAMKEAISNRYHHQEVYEVSGGKIILQAAERSREMVKQAINLIRKLLFQDSNDARNVLRRPLVSCSPRRRN